MNRTERERAKNPALMLTILIIVFLIPITLAYFLYSQSASLTGGSTNHGKLLSPPLDINKLKLTNSKGQLLDNSVNTGLQPPPSATRTNGQWMLLLLNSGPCQTICENGIHNMRQIQIATGKRRERIERAVLTYSNSKKDPKLQQLLSSKRYTGTRHLLTQKATFAPMMRQHVKQSYALKTGTVYIVDPLGNIMMSYAPNTNPADIYKDMQRLLKVSQIG